MATTTKTDEAIDLYNQGLAVHVRRLSIYPPNYGLDRDAALRLLKRLARVLPARTISTAKSRVR